MCIGMSGFTPEVEVDANKVLAYDSAFKFLAVGSTSIYVLTDRSSTKLTCCAKSRAGMHQLDVRRGSPTLQDQVSLVRPARNSMFHIIELSQIPAPVPRTMGWFQVIVDVFNIR